MYNGRNSKKTPQNHLILLCITSLAAFSSGAALAGTLLLADQFDGSALDSAWSVTATHGRSITSQNAPMVQDGYLTLAANVMDSSPVVTRTFAGTKKLRLEIRHMQHAGNEYYLPDITLGNQTKYIAVQFVRSSWSGDYCNRSDWYGKIKFSGGMLEGSVPCGNGDYSALATTLTTSAYLDRWLTSIIDYDADAGKFELDVDGDGTFDYSATISADNRGLAFDRMTLHAYGWYTGHWAKFDSIKVYDMSSVATCDTTTPYNQGYAAGETAAKAACLANPAACGISTASTGSGSSASIQNESEPNNAESYANSLRADGSTLYGSWNAASTDADLYKFTVAQGDTFDFDLKAASSAQEVRFEIYTNQSGEGYRSFYSESFSLNANTSKRISIPLGTPQTYYLNLRGWTVTANTRYEFSLKPRNSTATTGSSSTYDQGYTAAMAACQSNPSSCGINTASTSSSNASYDPVTGLVRIPKLNVPNVFGTTLVYSIDLGLINTNPMQFQLRSAAQVQ